MSGAARKLSAERAVSAACGTAIAYRVRRSARARRIRLTVTAAEGLVVTVPARALGVLADARARAAVRERAAWALSALDTVAERRALVLAGPEAILPAAVELRVAGRVLPVSYLSRAPRAAPAPAVARERDGVLAVVAATGADGAADRLAAVRRWRDRTARALLPALLGRYAQECGLAMPARVAVRAQRTRWGSCSSRGTVSLNRDLLFLPPHLVRYVIVHELAHLTHLDHSVRFWELVREHCPDANALRDELRRARDDYVPVWADA